MNTTLLTQLCAIPTSPFNEQRVIAWVLQWSRRFRKLQVARDSFGNMLLQLPAATPAARKLPRVVMVAHLDHPGFTAIEMTDRKTLYARFNGGVRASFFIGQAVRFFDTDRTVRGRITHVDTSETGAPTGATIAVPRAVAPGTIGMWDQTEPRINKHRFSCRVCDDLAGVASALAVLEWLHRQKLKSTVAVLLTRAEEEGFIGAIAAAQDGKLLRKSDRIISIECSAEQSYARQADGVVIRTGDRTSIFNSAFTAFIQQQAEALSGKLNDFKFQRALMPGGTCEGTIFDAWGYIAAAVCVPLGNYHNMDMKSGKIGPEYVDLRDWHNMVQLLSAVACNAASFTNDHTDLQKKLLKRFDRFKPLL